MTTIDWVALGFPPGNWDEKKIWGIECPCKKMKVAEFFWLFDIPYWKSDDGEEFVISPNDVIRKHPKSTKESQRTEQSDLSFPLEVIHYKGRWVILDGVHRVVKAFLQGNKEVSVRVFPEERLSEIMEAE